MSAALTRATADTFILSAASRTHYHQHPGQLSIKTMTNGRAIYTLGDGRRIAVDGSGYLILNEQQAYTIEIESPTVMRSFCIFFPDGMAGEVLHAIGESMDALLDSQNAADSSPPVFFETLIPHDEGITLLMDAIRAAHEARSIDELWLEEQLRRLVARMLISQQRHLAEQISAMPAARPATRDELFRRLAIGRDFMHASLSEPLTLEQIAAAAALSPFHFQRAFKEAFGQTPHEYLTQQRIEQAQFLLRSTDLPITEICFSLGFSSPGSFSTLFHRHAGCSPRAYRQYNLRG